MKIKEKNMRVEKMSNDQKFLDKLVFEKCYKFLDEPVILTSGKDLTPFFLNGENIIGDYAYQYKDYELDPVEMYNWARIQLNNSNEFRKVMEIVLSKIDLEKIDFISGGRTRDWPFSAALAYLANKDAVFLYKPQDGSNPILIKPNGSQISPKTLNKQNGYHFVDLVTQASSVTGKGYWLDQINYLNGNIDKVFAFVDRNQGAEENIKQKGTELCSLVKITHEWMDMYDSEHKDIVITYLKNPSEWTKNYLQEIGIGCLKPYFDPLTKKAQKDNRILKFINYNFEYLKKIGLLEDILSISNNFRAVEDLDRGVFKNERFETALKKYS